MPGWEDPSVLGRARTKQKKQMREQEECAELMSQPGLGQNNEAGSGPSPETPDSL